MNAAEWNREADDPTVFLALCEGCGRETYHAPCLRGSSHGCTVCTVCEAHDEDHGEPGA
jgi:hypothetical protein